MQPFFESTQQVDGKPQVVIYHGRWEDVWPTLGLKLADVALCWADPPYGINLNTNGDSGMGRGKSNHRGRNWKPVAGDRHPHNPSDILAFPRLALWGANHFAGKLPDSPSWWVWNKRENDVTRTQGDGEAAWTNLGGPLRIFNHHWDGFARASEGGMEHLHPTQKPVALAEWGFQRAGLKPGQLVFAPYLGSGPEVRAALNMGLRIIGCDVDADYCRTVVEHRVALAAPKRGQEGQALLSF